MRYDPSGSILFISICSLTKAEGGIPDYDPDSTIGLCLDKHGRETLLQTRNEIRALIRKDSQLKWQGVPLRDLGFNHGLVFGKDFGGGDGAALYMPAIYRYEGRLYQTLGAQGKDRLLRSRHHFLILSALYGLLTPIEHIQLYSCPLSPCAAELWASHGFLTKVLVSYVKAAGIKRIIDLTAMAPYRNLLDWAAVLKETGIETVHCFHHMGAGDHALIPFGLLLRNYLIDSDEDELLTLPSDYSRNGVIFRSLSTTIEGYPTEVGEIKKADLEVPMLEGYSVEDIQDIFSGGLPAADGVRLNSSLQSRSWLFALTSGFRRQVALLPKNLQGRILEAVLDICKDPLELRGDSKKPLSGELSGKWRYRLGDFRLIYKPDADKRIVFLLVLSARGDPNLY